MPEVGDNVAVAEGHLGRRLRVRVGRARQEGARGRRGHPAVVVDTARGTCKCHTGWPFTLFPTSSCHQITGAVLVWGACTKTELLIWCQQEVWNNVNGQPVLSLHIICSLAFGLTLFMFSKEYLALHMDLSKIYDIFSFKSTGFCRHQSNDWVIDVLVKWLNTATKLLF